MLVYPLKDGVEESWAGMSKLWGVTGIASKAPALHRRPRRDKALARASAHLSESLTS